MSSESLKKLYDELYTSSSQLNQETKDLQEIKESEYIKIPSPEEVDPITKPVPLEFPRATIPFRTSNAYQLFSEEKILYNIYFENKDNHIRIIVHERDSNPKFVSQSQNIMPTGKMKRKTKEKRFEYVREPNQSQNFQ